MARLVDIDIDKVDFTFPLTDDLQGLMKQIGIEMAKSRVLEAPIVDAVPVIRGRWVKRGIAPNVFFECSECYTVGSPSWKCCPLCTARMDLEDVDNG